MSPTKISRTCRGGSLLLTHLCLGLPDMPELLASALHCSRTTFSPHSADHPNMALSHPPQVPCGENTPAQLYTEFE